MGEDQLLKNIKKKQYNAIIRSEEYKLMLTEMSSRIIEKSKAAPNEATIENYFDCELFAFFKEVFSPLGFKYNPVKEAAISTKRHVTKGRADTTIGALVIEFKQPSTLSNKTLKDKAVSQLIDYLNGLELSIELVGYVTDGVKGCFVVRDEKGIQIGNFTAISYSHLDRLIQTIIGLNLTVLSSKSIVENFCNPPTNNGIAFDLVKILYNNLSKHITPKTRMLFNEWKELFNLSHDDISKQQSIIDRRKSLEDLLQTRFNEVDEEYTALFALQTAYVIIIKVVAYRIVSIVRYKSSLLDFESLVDVDSEALRMKLASLEEGAIFRDYGITNLLEGDFFSWYSTKEQWTGDLANCLHNIFNTLNMYSNKPMLNNGAKSADFFKELYQSMMPSAVRHSLGEYYTKRWMAK